MLRTVACAVVALFLCAGGLLADEIKGKIKKIDADTGKITVTTADGKDVEVTVAKDAKIVSSKDAALTEGLKDKHLKEGTQIVITADKGTASKVQLAQPRPKP